MKNKIEIFQSSNGEIEFRGDMQDETVWGSLDQISKLFGRDKSGISRHIKNIFNSGELDKNSVVAKIATTANDGKTYQVDYFNLDMIISIGYRVDSKEATQFRKWATTILKKYLTDGYAINEKKIIQTKTILNNLKQTINFLSTKEIGQSKEILYLLQNYTKTLSLLESYDKSSIDDFNGLTSSYFLSYDEVKKVLAEVKTSLIAKNEATTLFAQEKDTQLDGIIGNLYQTFGGVEYSILSSKTTHSMMAINEVPLFCLSIFWIDVIIYIKIMERKR